MLCERLGPLGSKFVLQCFDVWYTIAHVSLLKGCSTFRVHPAARGLHAFLLPSVSYLLEM